VLSEICGTIKCRKGGFIKVALFLKPLARNKYQDYIGTMTLYNFQFLPLREQAEITYQGAFLMSRIEKKHSIMLYKVNDFYVEVYYSNASNEIIEFYPFTSQKMLELYFNLRLN
jgi:hypothetical protein